MKEMYPTDIKSKQPPQILDKFFCIDMLVITYFVHETRESNKDLENGIIIDVPHSQ